MAIAERWPTGATLRVRFLGGNPLLQRKVREMAQEWTRYANLSFDFGDHIRSEIRIAFDPEQGFKSFIGRASVPFPEDVPTMNLGWATSPSDKDIRRKVLHEFGHALGFIHEHQSPSANIHWNRDQVYKDYKKLGWTHAEVDANIFTKLPAESTNFSAFDPLSVMLYPIPREHTLDGFSVPWNTELSETDKWYAALFYPRTPRETYGWESRTGDVNFTRVPGKQKRWRLVYTESGNTAAMSEVHWGEYIELATQSGRYRARLYPTHYLWKSPGQDWENAGEGVLYSPQNPREALSWEPGMGQVTFTRVPGKQKQWQLRYATGKTDDMNEVHSGEYIELASKSGRYRARLYPTHYLWKSPGQDWENAGVGNFTYPN